MRYQLVVSGVIALVAVSVLAGCGSGLRYWTGTVTQIRLRLCVGMHAATGACFGASPLAAQRGLWENECIVVTFTGSAVNDPSLEALRPATQVERRAAVQHADCLPS